MISNTAYINIFCNYLLSEKRRSENTLISYKNDLSQLLIFLEQAEKNVVDISTRDLRNWLLSFDSSVSSKTITRKIACLKSFYKFLFFKEYVGSNPAKALRNPKLPKRLPSLVEESDLDLILDAELPSDFPSIRDRLIISLIYGAGLRREELINLVEKNINFNSNLIKVVGKGSKERIIPITENLKQEIQKYIEFKNSFFGNICDELIVTDSGNKSYPSLVYRAVVKSLSEVTIQKKKSPHVLRHSYATHILNRGADLNAVKELLGHSSLSSTQVYTHNSLAKLKSVFDQAHPKA